MRRVSEKHIWQYFWGKEAAKALRFHVLQPRRESYHACLTAKEVHNRSEELEMLHPFPLVTCSHMTAEPVLCFWLTLQMLLVMELIPQKKQVFHMAMQGYGGVDGTGIEKATSKRLWLSKVWTLRGSPSWF
ncbi:uncharacterized protein LOC107314671 [Coturnix japonica]|uniref:uncharacterized protein LOC107314671 n=1 Tax=Coturnix japonica TaxID=93934 RepID=UPI0013A5BE05|nr:uncharacterized protein LOC107314671 [Coturnix japonica]